MTKCNYIYFKSDITNLSTCQRTRENNTISINGYKIKQVACIKFLGVILDENLNWYPHVEYLCKKLRSYIGAIKIIMDPILNPGGLHISHL